MENLNKRKTEWTSKTVYYWKDSLCNVIDSVFMIKLWLWQTIWTSCSSFKTRFTKLKRVFLVGLCNYFGLSSLNDWETDEYQPQKRTQSFIKYQRWSFFQKWLTAYISSLLSQKTPSQIFDRVLNMPQSHVFLDHTHET